MMIDRGCKAVLYMMYEEDIKRFGRISIKWCGDNLIPFIREACETRDVEVSCTRMFPYFSREYGEFNGSLKMVDTGKICNTALEYFDEYLSIKEEKGR